MNNTMAYKGYVARIDFDPRDDILVGRVIGIADSITFHGATVDELTLDFHAAIDQYLLDCEASGRAPETAPSGNLA